MKHLTIETPVGMEALEMLNTTIAVEAFSLRSVANRAIDIIPNLSHAFSEVLSSNSTDKYDLKPLSVNLVVLDRALKGSDYMSVGNLNVYVPQGFQGNFKAYLTAFDQALNFSNGIIERMLRFNQYISALISNKDTRRSTKDLSIATNGMELAREDVRKALAEFNRSGYRGDRAPLKDVYASLGEISDCTMDTGSLIRKAISVTLAEVTKITDDASVLLKTLGEQAINGQIDDMSNEAYKSLSSATLTMARDVELHSLLMYSAFQIKKAVEDTSVLLINALRYDKK